MIVPKKDLLLERYTESRDSIGTSVRTWASISTVQGFLTTLSGNERFKYGKTEVESSHLFTVSAKTAKYPSTTITEKDRFRDTSTNKIFDITFVDNIGFANDWLKIYLTVTE